MEKLLVKTGLYSFFITFVALIAFKDRRTFVEVDVYETLPYSDYFFQLSQWSFKISLLIVLGTYIYLLFNKNDRTP